MVEAAQEVRVKNTGLRGIAVADTKISYIDGEKGILIYRGYRIEELAQRSTFPETAYLLLNGTLPTQEQLAVFETRLAKARQVPSFIFDTYSKLPRNANPMDVLQATVPLLATDDPDLGVEKRDAAERMAVRLIARFPVVVAAWDRIRKGLAPVAPDESLSHAANFLWMLHGERPGEETARDLDVCLILHADHTFNASTFACREVVSTRAHMYAGVAAGIGALSGSLHGGANERVMKMLFQIMGEIESEESIESWVKKHMGHGERVMGMGHAVYKTTDPRAVILKRMSEELGRRTGQEQWYRLLSQLENAANEEFRKKGKDTIKTNVDFYSGSVYHVMGIPTDLMTPIFAISRIAGWCAHIIEEQFAEAQGKPALYRPQAEYIGDYCGPMGCVYQPMDVRA